MKWKSTIISDKYQISTTGLVKSLKTNKLLSIQISNTGYKRCELYHNGRKKKHHIHRMVAIAFVPNPENKKYVNHKNGIKEDNRPVNLEWCTHSENMKHAYRELNKPHPRWGTPSKQKLKQ